MFAAPRKKMRGQSTQIITVREMSLADVHDTESSNIDYFSLTACVLYVPSEPRWVEIADRKSNEKEQVPVVTVLLADHTGPITLELWRKQADEMIRSMEKWGSRDQEPIVVTVKYFFIRSANRGKVEHLLPTKKIASSDRTKIALVDERERGKLLNITPSLNSNLFTANFSLLKRSAPYAVSVKGIIASLQPESFSRDSNPMRNFKLHDNTGKSIACYAFGRQTESSALADGNEVVLFFAQALPGNQSNNGALWLYDTAHIVLLKPNCRIPPLQETITLKE